jgi:uncharacterized membrane protein YbaN (DUF454 family)
MALERHSEAVDGVDQEPRIVTSRIGRVAFAGLGFVCLGLGIFGYFTPFPGTVFLLLSVWFFMRSNERMYRWVLDHPRFGPMLRSYYAGHGIRRRIKVVAITAMWVSVLLSVTFAVEGMGLRALLLGLAVVGTAFILTRPTTEVVLAGGETQD